MQKETLNKGAVGGRVSLFIKGLAWQVLWVVGIPDLSPGPLMCSVT